MLTDENKVWKVTTEGDCEGRTMKDLGMFRGNVIEIAKHLSGHAFYALHFSEVKTSETDIRANPKDSVSLTINNMNHMALIATLKSEGYEVGKSNFYNAISVALSEEERSKIKKEIALSKLTDEDRKILGLI